MKCVVIYHSMTGNTKKIAEAIHAGMSRSGEQCDIEPIKNVSSSDLAGYDLIGLGSPVIWMKEMGNVTNFIQNTMKSTEGKHAFAFCTHGALPAKYLSRVVPAMTQRGLTVIGWNDWFGSVYFPCIPKPYFTDGHPDAIDLKEAEDFGQKMVERSRRIYQGETQLIPTFPRGKEYDEIYDPILMEEDEEIGRERWKNIMDALAIPFKVNLEKCNYPKCTFCIDNCPMGAINFSASPPTFNVDCEKCFLCEMACPRGAIEFDYTDFQKAHEILPGESPLEKSLEVFEVRGRFRRLVPLKDIGWDTPFWTFKKPRYKIV